MTISFWTAKDGSDLPDLLVKAVYDKVHECYAKAELFFSKSFSTCKVEFGMTGLCAGKAHMSKNRITLNSGFLIHEPVDMVNDTIPHEIAHLLTYQIFSKVTSRFGYNKDTNPWPKLKAHGKEWKFIMQTVFGLSGERCHRYAVERVAGRYRAARKRG